MTGGGAAGLPVDAAAVAAAAAAAAPAELAALGRRLRELGLTERAVRACFDVGSLAHVFHIDGGAIDAAALPPAAVVPALLVAGATVPVAQAERRLGGALAALATLHLVETVGADLRATAAVLPAGEGLVVCDRIDVRRGRLAVLVPDDSGWHLVGGLPERRVGRWLDVGTGCGLAPIAARGRAERVRGTDVNPRAVALAGLGAALSGVGLELATADLLAGAGGGWDLITFNAPIPAEVMPAAEGAPLYRHGPPGADLLARFWREAGDRLAPGGEVVVHSWQALRDYPACLGLGGEVVAARYTPAGLTPAFGVTRWRPGGPPRALLVERELDEATPHVRRDWLDAGP